MTIYQDLLALGAVMDHHESDLYIKATAEVRAYLARCPGLKVVSFYSAGERWLDIPFAYDPFWESRQ